MEPTPELAARVRRLLSQDPLSWRPVLDRGYAPSARWVVTLDGGSTVFVKAATNDHTRRAIRREIATYGALGARPFMPRLVGAEDDPEVPMLVLEDLSGARWPPPWDPEGVARVRRTLDEVASTPVPDGAPRIEGYRAMLTGWVHVAEDPAQFLSLGLATSAWLERALPALLEAEARAPLHGEALCHFDVRSDNLCFDGARTLLVDWNFAGAGNPVADLASWLPSLAAEGGPEPEEILPGAPELAALVSGYFAWKAGLAPEWLPGGDRVRLVQRGQLRAALPWAARALGLPPPDGHAFSRS